MLSRAIQFTQQSKAGMTGPKSSKIQSKKLIGALALNENVCFFNPGETGILNVNSSTKHNTNNLSSTQKSTTKFNTAGEKFHQGQSMKVSMKPE